LENLLIKHDEDKKLELLKTVCNRFDYSRRFHKDKHDLWEKCYKMYRAKSDEEGSRDEPDIKIAFVFGIVEKVVSKLIAPFVGKLPINIKPKKSNQQKQAENYYSIAKDFHNSPRRIIEYINATRERVITGSSWESEEWQNVYNEGFRWAINKVNEAIDVNMPTFGKVIKPVMNAASKIIRNVPISKYMRVKHKFPVKVGYSLNYPSVFKVFPQPNVLKMEDMKWVIEEDPFVALDDLKAAMYKDENGDLKPVYDLSYFEKLKEDTKKTIIPMEIDNNGNMNFQEAYSDTGKNDYSEAGVDGVYLLTMRTPNEILVIANNQVIQHVKDPFHKPGIKMRIRVFTPDTQSLYGLGVVEPVISMLEELDDVHNLSMQNWVRIINRMILFDETAVPYPDDWEPRAGGKIRVKTGTDLPRAFMPIEQGDVTGTMITTESNLRGLIETILAVTDFAPGTQGTKPYHSTFGGLMELQQSYAQRFATILLIDQSQTIQQMDSMYWFYEQFMFDPITLEGSFGAVDYTREDIDTDGHGFLFTASSDPSFGDSAVERNQAMVLLAQSLQFEKERLAMRRSDWQTVDCSKIMADVIMSFKHGNIEDYLKNPDETEDPDDEFKYMIQGIPVEVNPKENLIKHYISHLKQQKRIEMGAEQYPPEVVAALSEHLAMTQEVASAVLLNPEMLVNEDMKNDIKMEGRQDVAAPNFGQNLPAATGGGQGEMQ